MHHLAVSVTDVQAEFDRLKQLNVSFIDDEITTLPNGCKYFFVRGTEGEWIELFER